MYNKRILKKGLSLFVAITFAASNTLWAAPISVDALRGMSLRNAAPRPSEGIEAALSSSAKSFPAGEEFGVSANVAYVDMIDEFTIPIDTTPESYEKLMGLHEELLRVMAGLHELSGKQSTVLPLPKESFKLLRSPAVLLGRVKGEGSFPTTDVYTVKTVKDGILLVIFLEAPIWPLVDNSAAGRLLNSYAGVVKGGVVLPKGHFLIPSEAVDSGISVTKTEILEGHTDQIVYAEFSPDGKNTVTAGRDATARIWDARTGKCRNVLEGHTDRVISATFSPNGKMLMTAAHDGTIRIWDAETGECLKVLEEGLAGRATSASFFPDGKAIVTGNSDGIVRIRDVKTYECLKTLEVPNGAISVASSPDEEILATAGHDATVRIWHIETGECLNELMGCGFWVNPASFSPDGKVIMTSRGKETLMWEVKTQREPLKTLEARTDFVNTATFSPDGKMAVGACGDGTIRIWDAETGKCLKVLEGHAGTINSALFSPDGKNIVTAGWDKTARIWQLTEDSAAKSMPVATPALEQTGLYTVPYVEKMSVFEHAEAAKQALSGMDAIIQLRHDGEARSYIDLRQRGFRGSYVVVDYRDSNQRFQKNLGLMEQLQVVTRSEKALKPQHAERLLWRYKRKNLAVVTFGRLHHLPAMAKEAGLPKKSGLSDIDIIGESLKAYSANVQVHFSPTFNKESSLHLKKFMLDAGWTVVELRLHSQEYGQSMWLFIKDINNIPQPIEELLQTIKQEPQFQYIPPEALLPIDEHAAKSMPEGLSIGPSKQYTELMAELSRAQDVFVKQPPKPGQDEILTNAKTGLYNLKAYVSGAADLKTIKPSEQAEIVSEIGLQLNMIELAELFRSVAEVSSDADIIINPDILPDQRQRHAIRNILRDNKWHAALEGALTATDSQGNAAASTRVVLLEDVLDGKVVVNKQNAILLSDNQDIDGIRLLNITGFVNEEGLFPAGLVIGLARGLLSLNKDNFQTLYPKIQAAAIKLSNGRTIITEELKAQLQNGTWREVNIIIYLIPGIDGNMSTTDVENRQRQALAAFIFA